MSQAPQFPTPARLLDLAAELVQTPSVLRDEDAAADVARRAMTDLGFEAEIDVDGNAVGRIQGSSSGPTIVYDAHLDTVDVEPRDAWSRDPFSGLVTGGRLHGRGAADMKGALAAMICGLATIDRERIRGTVIVSASVGEETIEGAALEGVLSRNPADAVVIGEASALTLATSGRGRGEWKLTAPGRPAHASSPAQGINAVDRMVRVLRELEGLELASDPRFGESTQCVTDIISSPYPAHSVVPIACTATYERRLLPGATEAALTSEIRAAARQAGCDDLEIRLAKSDYTSPTGTRFEVEKWLPPWQNEGGSLLEAARSALRTLRGGMEPEETCYQFCTNAAYCAGKAGIPTVGFGPARERDVHIVDESAAVEDLVLAAHGYRLIAESLLSP